MIGIQLHRLSFVRFSFQNDERLTAALLMIPSAENATKRCIFAGVCDRRLALRNLAGQASY